MVDGTTYTEMANFGFGWTDAPDQIGGASDPLHRTIVFQAGRR